MTNIAFPSTGWCPQGDSNPCSQQPAGDANASLRPLTAPFSAIALGTPVAEVATAQRESSALSRCDRSALFTAYNVARGMVSDIPRLNRGLGLAMRRRPRDREYVTTDTRCSCPDFTYRQGPKGLLCKHLLSRALKAAAGEGVIPPG